MKMYLKIVDWWGAAPLCQQVLFFVCVAVLLLILAVVHLLPVVFLFPFALAASAYLSSDEVIGNEEEASVNKNINCYHSKLMGDVDIETGEVI